MGSGASFGNSRKTTANKSSKTSDDTTDKGNFSYYFSNDGVKFTKTPLAYRDTDGKVKLYADGEAPTVLVPELPKSADTVEEDDDEDDKASSHSSVASEDIRSVTPDFDLPHPPRKKRREIMPDAEVIRLIDEHSTRAPEEVKGDFFKLVDYLTEVTCTPLEHARAFYVWITHNVNYDTSGFFGRGDVMPTDSSSVLKNRVAVSQGYTELMEAFCSIANIPVKTIHGYVKPYGYRPGSDASLDQFTPHAWNAVFIDKEWRLLDVTWGAGFVKNRECTYVPRFNDVYFLTNPEIFATDHFPFAEDDSKYSDKWQLLDDPFDKKVFCEILDMDKHGKMWELEPISHRKAMIHDVELDVDIVFAETSTRLSEYVAFLFIDGKKLPQYTYVYKQPAGRVHVHARFPVVGEVVLQLYGRREADPKTNDLESLLKYIIIVTKCYESLTPYPLTYTPYGVVDNLESFGIYDVGNFHNTTKTGNVVGMVKPQGEVDLIPRLLYGDHTEDLKRFVFVTFSDDFENIKVLVRLPFKGNYRLMLLGHNSESAIDYKPFMNCLIENGDTISDDVFPVALAHSVKFKCCLVEPLRKVLPSGTEIMFQIRSRFLSMVKVCGVHLKKTDEWTFCGKVKTPTANSDFKVLGVEEKDGAIRSLYVFTTI